MRRGARFRGSIAPLGLGDFLEGVFQGFPLVTTWLWTWAPLGPGARRDATPLNLGGGNLGRWSVRGGGFWGEMSGCYAALNTRLSRGSPVGSEGEIQNIKHET